jgi:hypothetical protein
MLVSIVAERNAELLALCGGTSSAGAPGSGSVSGSFLAPVSGVVFVAETFAADVAVVAWELAVAASDVAVADLAFFVVVVVVVVVASARPVDASVQGVEHRDRGMVLRRGARRVG